jgi:hypothetical protein
LLLLDDAKRSLSVVGAGGNLELLKTGSEISSVACSPVESRVAVNTVNGEIFIYSLDHQAVLMRYLPGSDETS